MLTKQQLIENIIIVLSYTFVAHMTSRCTAWWPLRHAVSRMLPFIYSHNSTITYLQQVLSEFPPNSHSVIKPVIVPVTRVLHYVCNKFDLKIFIAFRFRVNRRHWTDRQTDGVQHLMRPAREGRVIQAKNRQPAKRSAKSTSGVSGTRPSTAVSQDHVSNTTAVTEDQLIRPVRWWCHAAPGCGCRQ